MPMMLETLDQLLRDWMTAQQEFNLAQLEMNRLLMQQGTVHGWSHVVLLLCVAWLSYGVGRLNRRVRQLEDRAQETGGQP